MIPEIPPGLPSSLLQRRADLAALEQGIRAAGARIGIARADFLPRFSLTATAGFASAHLSSLLGGSSRLWSIGPEIHLRYSMAVETAPTWRPPKRDSNRRWRRIVRPRSRRSKKSKMLSPT